MKSGKAVLRPSSKIMDPSLENLGERFEEQEYEMKREDETRTGLECGV